MNTGGDELTPQSACQYANYWSSIGLKTVNIAKLYIKLVPSEREYCGEDRTDQVAWYRL